MKSTKKQTIKELEATDGIYVAQCEKCKSWFLHLNLRELVGCEKCGHTQDVWGQSKNNKVYGIS